MDDGHRSVLRTLSRSQKDNRREFLEVLTRYNDRESLFKNIIVPRCGSYYIPPEHMREVFAAYYRASGQSALQGMSVQAIGSRRGGVYLDLDVRYKHALLPSGEDEEVARFTGAMNRTNEIMRQYFELYLEMMSQTIEITEEQFTCSVVITMRDEVIAHEETVDGESVLTWKHGAHAYFNSISLSRNARVAIHDRLMEVVNDTALGISIEEKTAIPIGQQLDSQPLGSSVTFPFSTKPGGCSYSPRIKGIFTIVKRGDGFVKMPITWTPIDHLGIEDLCRSIPIYEEDRIRATHMSDGIEEELVVAPGLGSLLMDVSADFILGDAAESCPKAALMINLLSMLPIDPYVTDHSRRLSLTNAVVHELEDDWAFRILFWFLNQSEDDASLRYNQTALGEKMCEAKAAGKRSGLNKLLAICREIDSERVNELIAEFQTDTIEDIIMMGYPIRMATNKRPSHMSAAMSLFSLVGQNYNARSCGKNRSTLISHDYYYYDDNAEIGPGYKKWQEIDMVAATITREISTHLIPQYQRLRREYSRQLASLTEDETDSQAVLGSKIEYLTNGEGQLGESGYKDKVIKEFAIKVINKSRANQFDKRLNKNKFLTGVYNGILEFKPEVPEFILHDGDNRSLFVSRSLGCVWDPDLNHSSPKVQELVDIGRTIMPSPEIFEHRLITRGAAVFAGGGGSILEIDFGTGSDGKTAWSNAELYAGGFASGGSDSAMTGYATTHSPLVWQKSKETASSHDAGICYLQFIRIALCAEPAEKHPEIDGTALKLLLGHTALHVRRSNASAGRFIELTAYCTLQTNAPLLISNPNPGTIRRILIIESEAKFYDEISEHMFADLPNSHRADESVRERMSIDKGLHSALLFLWAEGAKRFATDYDCQITRVPAPSRAKTITKKLVDTTDLFAQFVKRNLSPARGELIMMEELLDAFSAWRRVVYPDERNPRSESLRNKLMTLCTSSIARCVVDRDGLGMSALSIGTGDPVDMRLSGFRFKTPGAGEDDLVAGDELELGGGAAADV